MPSQVTVTAKQGVAQTITAKVFKNVRTMLFDHVRQVLVVTQEDGVSNEFDISGVTTVTDTVSGTSNTWVVS